MNKIATVNAFIDGEMSATTPNFSKVENTTSFSDFITQTYSTKRKRRIVQNYILIKDV
jgi:hypothetical protein